MRIEYTDHQEDPAAWADELGISKEATDLYLHSDVLDLHVDSFIWNRIWGYDLRKRHGHGLLGARFYSQADFPRILEAGVTGATWVITTNPSRRASVRARVFRKNLERLRNIFGTVESQFSLVRNTAEYRKARTEGKHGAFVGIQGGNALDARDALDTIVDDMVLRITLVHLSNSSLGTTSSPANRDTETGLTARGRDYVAELNRRNIFVDLAHISKKGFWDAVEVHDKSKPFIVTHTGVEGVRPHWRNLDDDQLRAIADSGGTIGIMYQNDFLGPSRFDGKASWVVDHLEHIVQTVGEDHASLGSDWDGAIIPPKDMPTCLELPKLAQLMLDRGWSPERIKKILGGNFLRVVEQLRG